MRPSQRKLIAKVVNNVIKRKRIIENLPNTLKRQHNAALKKHSKLVMLTFMYTSGQHKIYSLPYKSYNVPKVCTSCTSENFIVPL